MRTQDGASATASITPDALMHSVAINYDELDDDLEGDREDDGESTRQD